MKKFPELERSNKTSTVLGAWQHADQFEEGLLEGAATREVDEEVDGGVEDEGQVVEAGQAEDPVWRGALLRSTGKELF